MKKGKGVRKAKTSKKGVKQDLKSSESKTRGKATKAFVNKIDNSVKKPAPKVAKPPYLYSSHATVKAVESRVSFMNDIAGEQTKFAM